MWNNKDLGGVQMEKRRAVQERLQSRLREREIDAEGLWGALQVEAKSIDPALASLVERASRRVTWALWEMAMYEAANVLAEIEDEHPQHENTVTPWLCQSCKRRMLRVVGSDDEATFDDRAAG